MYLLLYSFLLLDRLQLNEPISTVPTIGFNVETVSIFFFFDFQITYNNLTFQVWDLGGQTSIRPYWRCYYQNTGKYIAAGSALDAIVFVVDSADTDRIPIAKTELMAILNVWSFVYAFSFTRKRSYEMFVFWFLQTNRM